MSELVQYLAGMAAGTIREPGVLGLVLIKATGIRSPTQSRPYHPGGVKFLARRHLSDQRLGSKSL
jgi:hypothetical protein